MPPALLLSTESMVSTENDDNNGHQEKQYQKGVKHLCDGGIKTVPTKYILPALERPSAINGGTRNGDDDNKVNIKLPIIDFAQLQGPNRLQVLQSLAFACENYGFFQLVNHGISEEVISSMRDVARGFFELPMTEREKYMSSDMSTPVRYGTSFNQTKDGVFCWRDFLKLVCNPLSDDLLPHWPSSPLHFRKLAVTYANETKLLFAKVVEAILESLGLQEEAAKNKTGEQKGDEIIKQLLEDGSQLMVVNYYPKCPSPDLTLGIPPHSDYGFLTLLLQDDVPGLQIHHRGDWLTVEPIPGAFVINVGDHLEIFSNGRYKSVLHRVVVNSLKSRISIASLHSLSFETTVRPSPKLISESNPRRYKDTDFATFLEYINSCDSKEKNFLESRKLT